MEKVRIQYVNDGYESLHPLFVQEVTRLRPLISKTVAFLEQMAGETRGCCVGLCFSLTGQVAGVADNCCFDLTVETCGLGKQRKLRLELTDPNGWGMRPNEAKPFVQPIGFVRLPPCDCIGMEDELVCPTCGQLERECTCPSCLFKKDPPREL